MIRYPRIYLDCTMPFPGVAASLPSFDESDGYIIERVNDHDVRVSNGVRSIVFPWARVKPAFEPEVATLTEVPPPAVPEFIEFPKKRKARGGG